MKPILIIFLLAASIGSQAQKSKGFASVPLSERSVGKQFDIGKFAALSGINTSGKYILIDMFFQACGPCRRSIPFLNELTDTTKYPQLQVVSVDPVREDSASMGQFIERFKIQYPVVSGGQAVSIWSMIGNNGFPFAILLDPSGKIVAIERGFSKEGFRNLQRKLR